MKAAFSIQTDARGHHVCVNDLGQVQYDYSVPPPMQRQTLPLAHLQVGHVYRSENSFENVLTVAPSALARLLCPEEGGQRLLISHWETTPQGNFGAAIGVGDAAALFEFGTLLRVLYEEWPARPGTAQERGLVKPSYLVTRDTEPQWRECHLICVGGPEANYATGRVGDKLREKRQLRYWFEGYSIVDLASTNSARFVYSPAQPDDQRIPGTDYCMLAWLPNPLRTQAGTRSCWIFAGCQTYGTLAAIDAFSNAEFVSGLANLAQQGYFQLILKGSWEEAEHIPWPTSVELVVEPYTLPPS